MMPSAAICETNSEANRISIVTRRAKAPFETTRSFSANIVEAANLSHHCPFKHMVRVNLEQPREDSFEIGFEFFRLSRCKESHIPRLIP